MSPSPANSATAESLRSDAEAIVAKLLEAGHVAYFAGGCVRDQLLGIEPKDFDIATDAPPERIRKIFAQTQAVGAAFGVVLVHFGRSTVEVATFRTDGQYFDGRHPASVRFSTPQEDAQRRDFTINGLFLDLKANRVIDYVGGEADLRARTLRAIGKAEDRFSEDHLRLLRAIRFAARFDLTIEPATAHAVLASIRCLSTISPERIAEELRAMLAPVTRARAFELLDEFDVPAILFRFAPAVAEVVHSAPILLGEAPAPLPLAMAAAAWRRVGDPAIFAQSRRVAAEQQALRKALRWSNAEGEHFQQTLHAVASLLHTPELPLARRRRLLALPAAPLIVRLLLALQDRREPTSRRIDELLQLAEQSMPEPWVDGEDLLAIGLTPGPLFARLLEAVYDAQLEGRVCDPSTAVEFVKNNAARAGA